MQKNIGGSVREPIFPGACSRRGGGEAACIKGPGNNLTRTIELGWPRIRRLKQRMRKNEDYDTRGLSGDLHDGLTLHSRSIVGMGSRNGGLLKAGKTYTFTRQDAALMQIRRGRVQLVKVQIMVNLSLHSAERGQSGSNGVKEND